MKIKLAILGLIVALAMLVLAACGKAGGVIGMPNPASTYCEDQGYTLEIRKDASGGEYGVCIFDDGTECEEWAYFRGECEPGQYQTAPEPPVEK